MRIIGIMCFWLNISHKNCVGIKNHNPVRFNISISYTIFLNRNVILHLISQVLIALSNVYAKRKMFTISCLEKIRAHTNTRCSNTLNIIKCARNKYMNRFYFKFQIYTSLFIHNNKFGLTSIYSYTYNVM